MLGEDETRARALYDLVAADYARAVPDLGAETAQDRALIDELARRTGPGVLLDVGCGTGRVAAHLAGLGVAVVGADLSGGMLAIARRLHPRLPLVQGSLARLPFADGGASGLLSWYSVIHTAPDDLPPVVAELARVVAVGAPLLVAFQCGRGERVDRANAFGHQVERTNYRHGVDHVAALLGENGVCVVDTVVRPPAAEHEPTDQAFLLGVREVPGSGGR